MKRVGISTSGVRLTADATNLWGLICFAYNVKNPQLVYSGSELLKLGEPFYDVVAKAEGDAPLTRNQFRPMMQALLAERFKLQIHHEMREMPVYELVLAKNGPKLKASADDARKSAQTGPVGGPNGRNHQVNLTKATIDELIDMIENLPGLDRPVLNKTGLTGTYDMKLIYTLDPMKDSDPGDISLLMAMQEQLGLKLESQKAMFDFVVVDHAEKPSGN
jgi:uncharacterized protein (TIGR03435 family)